MGTTRFICPENACHAICSDDDTRCHNCGLDIEWIGAFLNLRDVLGKWAMQPCASLVQKPTIAINVPLQREPIGLRVGEPTTIGRGTGNRVVLPDPDISLQHAIIAWQPGTPSYWLVDAQSANGTLVNRRPTIACRLHGGDLVQIGPFAWTFNDADGFLVPVAGIEGIELELDICLERLMNRGAQQVHTESRKQSCVCITKLHIRAGEFVAIVGESGAGKSTLVKAITRELDVSDHGRILVNGQDIYEHTDWFSSVLGHVPQQECVHPELTARQAVDFSARLRTTHKRSANAQRLEVERTLRQVDLPEGRWDAPIGKLSGGERQRVRIAVELVAHPRLLLLDEPGTGLDRAREDSLMRLLRNRHFRGCTTVMVTHHLQQLEFVSRVLLMRRGAVVRDATPDELLQEVPSHRFTDLDLGAIRVSGQAPESNCPSLTSRGSCGSQTLLERLPGHSERSLRRQLATLMSRELALIINSPIKRLCLPAFIVPIFFALALLLSIRPDASQARLFGFLSVISTIWMGSSLSLLSIVGEREVFEHERLLFLRRPAYLIAKVGVLWVVSLLQIGVFLICLRVALWLVGSHGPIYSAAWNGMWLMLVGLASVGLGLCISAVAKESTAAANFVLPLVMMVQIVFSVEVAGKQGASLADAYGEFTWHSCHREHCERRAQSWFPERGGWICKRCKELGKERLAAADPKVDRAENKESPSYWAAAISYLTVSRYGDLVMRSYDQVDAKEQLDQKFGYARWRREALACLVLLAVGLPTTAWLILHLQGRATSPSRLTRLAQRLLWQSAQVSASQGLIERVGNDCTDGR